MNRPFTKLAFVALYSTVLLGACLDETAIDEEEDLSETEQSIVTRVSGCVFEVDLSRETGQRFTLGSSIYTNYGCSEMYVYVRAGSHNWRLDITMPTGEHDPETCEAERLRARFEHGVAGGSYSAYGDFTDYGNAYRTAWLPGGSSLWSCTDPSIRRSLGANVRYKVSVRADGHRRLDNQDVFYSTTYTFTRI